MSVWSQEQCLCSVNFDRSIGLTSICYSKKQTRATILTRPSVQTNTIFWTPSKSLFWSIRRRLHQRVIIWLANKHFQVKINMADLGLSQSVKYITVWFPETIESVTRLQRCQASRWLTIRIRSCRERRLAVELCGVNQIVRSWPSGLVNLSGEWLHIKPASRRHSGWWILHLDAFHHSTLWLVSCITPHDQTRN